MSELSEFGSFVRELRVSGGHGSQRALAEKLKVSNSTVAKIESGVHEPSDDTLHKLAKVFNVPYEELLEKKLKSTGLSIKSVVTKLQKLNKEQVKLVNSLVDQLLEGNK